jgi:hypothetical protein
MSKSRQMPVTVTALGTHKPKKAEELEAAEDSNGQASDTARE